jgi:nucleoside-diphosphate-sugar epimerase
MTTLVTGANGFVGRAICEVLSRGTDVRAAVRGAGAVTTVADVVHVGSIDGTTDWRRAVMGVERVVHLASRVHMVHERSTDLYSQYRATNVEGTAALARAAVDAGVRSFVFVSTVKVHGEETSAHPYSERDSPRPQDAYGRSKREAEQVLSEIASDSAMRVSILRPPLVYGPGVRANFLRLLRAVDRALPLPLGAIDNRRSMIYLGNLADAIRVASEAEEGHGTFLVSDGEDISTADLFRRLAGHMRRPVRLLPLSTQLLAVAGKLIGASSAVRRLTGSLQVDSRAFREAFQWTPPSTLDEGLAATVTWYLERTRK